VHILTEEDRTASAARPILGAAWLRAAGKIGALTVFLCAKLCRIVRCAQMT